MRRAGGINEGGQGRGVTDIMDVERLQRATSASRHYHHAADASRLAALRI